MTTSSPPRRRGRIRTEPPKIQVPVKMTVDQRRRFKIACAELNLSYADLVDHLLNERDQRLENQRRQQVHPFHRPDDQVTML